MNKRARFLVGLVVGSAIGLGGVTWFNKQLEPMPAGPETMVRWSAKSIEEAAADLAELKVVRNPRVFVWYLKLTRQTPQIGEGSYAFKPGSSPDEVLKSLRNPVTQMVRIPEGWWISRVAKRLEDKNVCSAEEYIKLAGQPEKFSEVVTFQLPKDSLEGYLYPDTYELPPMLGAKAVIERQLRAFENKVVKSFGKKDLDRAVTVASMVELEAGLDEERAKIAGVIENRLARNMRLELDATVLYALGEWQVLGPGVVRTVKSPYNTYLNAGLPPGPIGSPSAKSIEAAMNPDSHGYLFYVARPDRSHLFSRTYDEHRANIRKARAEWREAE